MEREMAAIQNIQMTEYTKQALQDLAFDLACDAFGEPHDETVEAVYERLLWNWHRGMGQQGAVTVH